MRLIHQLLPVAFAALALVGPAAAQVVACEKQEGSNLCTLETQGKACTNAKGKTDTCGTFGAGNCVCRGGEPGAVAAFAGMAGAAFLWRRARRR